LADEIIAKVWEHASASQERLYSNDKAPALERVGQQARTIPTCEEEAEILLLFSVLIFIIIIIQLYEYYLLGMYAAPQPYD